MRAEDIKYSGDGLTMHGRVYWDVTRKGPRPGVLVFPGASGIADTTYESARRLAAAGYVALACDYYGGAFGVNATDAELLKLYKELGANPKSLRIRAQAAFDALSARPEVNNKKMAAIGYCFGGTTAVELATSGTPLSAVVGFHAGLDTVTLSDAKNIKARILLCEGDEDPIVPAKDIEAFKTAMRAAGVTWQINLYGGVVHSFTDPSGGKLNNPKLGRYDGWADQDSWSSMLRLFSEVFQ